MEALIYQQVTHKLQDTLVTLSSKYGVELGKSSQILTRLPAKYHVSPDTTKNSSHRCEARIWNGGISEQCHRSNHGCGQYCRFHGMPVTSTLCIACTEYFGSNVYHTCQWEHLGNINDKVPVFFRS